MKLTWAVFVAAAPADMCPVVPEPGVSPALPAQGMEQPHASLHIRIGGNYQHIGPVERIGAPPNWSLDPDAYYECLENVCPEELVNESPPCNFYEYYDTCEMVMANTDKNGNWNYKGRGKLTVDSADFGGSNEQRRAFFELVVNAMASQIAETKNCYLVKETDGITKMCNIGSHYQVRVSGVGRNGGGFLNAFYKFGGTGPGPYDCLASTGPIREFMKETTAVRLSKVYNVPFYNESISCCRPGWG